MPLLLVRHATAGNRRRWKGDDRLRPLDERGRRQADELVGQLRPFAPERVLSSPYVRCVQTVEPLAAVLGLPVEESPELAEGAGRRRALALLRELEGTTAVLCTHGDVIEDLLGDESEKGSTWALAVEGDGVRRLEYLPAPV
jgi:broad specificity phosphatase PhoE